MFDTPRGDKNILHTQTDADTKDFRGNIKTIIRSVGSLRVEVFIFRTFIFRLYPPTAERRQTTEETKTEDGDVDLPPPESGFLPEVCTSGSTVNQIKATMHQR